MQITQKPRTAFVAGIPINVPNEVRQNDPRFYISYNSSPRDYGCATTALVVKDPVWTKFYTLRGDHRAQYEAADTFEACLAYFASQPDMRHEISDTL